MNQGTAKGTSPSPKAVVGLILARSIVGGIVWRQPRPRVMSKRFPSFCICILLCSLTGTWSWGTEANPVRLLTYNVLADDDLKAQRVPRLMELIEKSDADVIALQEVAPWFVRELATQAWVGKYQVPVKDNALVCPGGLLVLSKSPVEVVAMGRLPGGQGRTFLVVRTQVRGRPFAVATCHLESPLEAGATRASQLDVFFRQLGCADAIMLGDFNFGDGEAESKRIPGAFQDAWLATNAGENGFTWDIERSPMARKGSFPGEASRRLDRILVKSRFLKPQKTEILGSAPVDKPGEVFPSDHFGLLASLEVVVPGAQVKTEPKALGCAGTPGGVPETTGKGDNPLPKPR